MYLGLFKLRELPFLLSPDPQFLYLSKQHARAKAYMESTIWFTDGFVVITGEIGAGKTTLIETFLRELQAEVVVARINQTQLTPTAFLQTVLVQFGFSPFSMKKPEILATLNQFLMEQYGAGRKVLLIVDEAQNLSYRVLEEIRMLSGVETAKEKALRIILAGQPELNEKLNSPDLVQLTQRVRLRFHLTALTKAETLAYIDHRLQVAGAEGRRIYAEETYPIIYKYTGGVPRLINTLCDTCMMAAFSRGQDSVTMIDLDAAIQELQWVEFASSTNRMHLPDVQLTHAATGADRDDLAAREDMLFKALHSLGERDAELAEARREHAKSVEQLQTAAKRSVEEAEANARSLREQLAADKKRSAAQLEAHDKQAAERLQANTKQAAAELEANSRRAAEQADSSAKQMGDLRGEVQSLRGELDTAQVEMKNSSAAVAALQSQIERGETALQATRRESERLKISAAEYLERLRSREWRRQDADNSMRALDAQLAASQHGAAKFEREARELNARLEALGNRIQEREQQIQALETAAAGSIEAARGQASALQAAEQTLQSLSKQIAAHESAHRQLQHERNELAATLEQRERSLQEVLAARADLTAKCATLEKQQGANGSHITQLEKQLAESQRLGGEAQEQAGLKRESLEAEARHAQEAIAAARAEASEHHARIDALNTELATAASVHGARVEELQQALEELQRHKLAIEEDALNTQIALEESARRTQEALTSARADAAEQRAKLESLDAEFTQTTARLQDMRRPADEAEAEVQRLIAALASKVQEVESAQDENRKLQGSLELARGALKEREFLIRRLERSANSNAQVLGHLQTNIELGSANPASLIGITGTAADTPPTLVRLDGAGANTAFTLAARTRVGRAADSDLRIDSTSVSRYHALIISGRHTIIEDLNSTNGVLINGRKVNRQKLKDGDLVTIGEIHFRFADGNTSLTDVNPVLSAPSESA